MGDQAHRPPRRLILVKHGLPQIRPGEPPGSWPLSEQGRRDAISLAARLAPYAPAALVASEEPKAHDTARALGEALGLPVSRDAGLGEQRNETGTFEAREVFEARVARMFEHPTELVLGEETGDAARARFDAAVERQRAAQPQGALILVAHGRVITLWASQRLGLEPMPLWRRLGLACALVIDGAQHEIIEP